MKTIQMKPKFTYKFTYDAFSVNFKNIEYLRAN